MNPDELVQYVEAALLCAGRPVAVDEFVTMFEGGDDAPDRSAVRDAIAAVAERWRDRAMEVTEVASGFRAQIRKEYSQAIAALWQERPVRYSRALLETLALIAYRQPISRGEIEEVRGVSVSSSIMKTLVEREWVRVVGHREAPGRPALFGTTRHFLDTFNLGSLESLPPLADLKDLEEPPPDLFTGMAEVPADDADKESPGTEADSPGADVRVEAHTPDTAAPDAAAPIRETDAYGGERSG
jgi:segregation and condensation protein B